VDKLECEGKDASYPSIDNGIGLKVGMVEHLLDILGIDFNNEVLDSYDIKLKMS